MTTLKKTGKGIADFIEVVLPVAVFATMFLTFLLNVIFRYVIKSPQNWTFELSVNSFVIVGLLGACAAHRNEDHVVFDLLYTRLGEKGRNLLRIISHILVIVFFTAAVPGTIVFLMKTRAVTSIMGIPVKYIFTSFLVLLASTIIRSANRLVLDIKARRSRTWVQRYNIEEENLQV